VKIVGYGIKEVKGGSGPGAFWPLSQTNGKRSERREGLKEEGFNFLRADQKGRRWTKKAKNRQCGMGLLVNYYSGACQSQHNKSSSP
jgi:hypothetical protein